MAEVRWGAECKGKPCPAGEKGQGRGSGPVSAADRLQRPRTWPEAPASPLSAASLLFTGPRGQARPARSCRPELFTSKVTPRVTLQRPSQHLRLEQRPGPQIPRCSHWVCSVCRSLCTVDVPKPSGRLEWFLLGQFSPKKSQFDQRTASCRFSECGPRPGSIGLPGTLSGRGRPRSAPDPLPWKHREGGSRPLGPRPLCDSVTACCRASAPDAPRSR